MSRVLCFEAQDANCPFRLSWATNAIRFRPGIGRVNGCRDDFCESRTPENPLDPLSRALSKVAVSERFGKQCVCIWAPLFCILGCDAPSTISACSISSELGLNT